MSRKLLIDGDIYAYQTAFSCQDKAIFEDTISLTVNTTEMKKKFKSKMASLVTRLGYPIAYLCFSGPTKDCFRKDILPTYKENRKSVEKPIGHSWLVDWIEKEYPKMFRKVERLEADDLMGIIATKSGSDFVIVSEDKDMQTIPGYWYNPRKDETFYITDGNAFHMLQTLEGDLVDNYKGCPGIGPKKAEKILKECDNAQERWEAVVDAYGQAGLEEVDALVQARCARILHWSDYNMKTQEIKLWEPGLLIQQ